MTEKDNLEKDSGEREDQGTVGNLAEQGGLDG